MPTDMPLESNWPLLSQARPLAPPTLCCHGIINKHKHWACDSARHNCFVEISGSVRRAIEEGEATTAAAWGPVSRQTRRRGGVPSGAGSLPVLSKLPLPGSLCPRGGQLLTLLLPEHGLTAASPHGSHRNGSGGVLGSSCVHVCHEEISALHTESGFIAGTYSLTLSQSNVSVTSTWLHPPGSWQ